MPYDWPGLINLILLLIDGTKIALKVFFLTLIFSLPLGLVTALGRMYGNRLIKGLMKFYILIMRAHR